MPPEKSLTTITGNDFSAGTRHGWFMAEQKNSIYRSDTPDQYLAGICGTGIGGTT